MALGVSFPFTEGSGPDGYFGSVTTVAEAIAQNARSLLITNWGERVMHPDFGCNIVEFCFEQQTQSTRQRISDRVVSQFSKWMPFVTITGVAVMFSSDDRSIPDNVIKVTVRIVYGNVTIDVAQNVGL